MSEQTQVGPCRTVDNDAAEWTVAISYEGVEACRAKVPIKEVWVYPDHVLEPGDVCSRCGARWEAPDA